MQQLPKLAHRSQAEMHTSRSVIIS